MRKCWLTEYEAGLYALSFQSDGVKDHERIHFHDVFLPPRRTEEEKHTVVLKYFTTEDLYKLYHMLSKLGIG